MMLLRIAVIAFGFVLCVGCSSKVVREDEARIFFAHAGEPVREIRAFRLTDWRALDRDHLVLWRALNDAYLIKVSAPCGHLDFAQTISVDYRAPVLRSRFDAILVEGRRCLIESIRPVDYRKVREDLRALRRH